MYISNLNRRHGNPVLQVPQIRSDKAGLILRKINPNYYLSEIKQETATEVIIFK